VYTGETNIKKLFTTPVVRLTQYQEHYALNKGKGHPRTGHEGA
jgi:hypothetical protein